MSSGAGPPAVFPFFLVARTQELILQLLELANAPPPVGSVGLKDAQYSNKLSAEYNPMPKRMYSHIKHKEPALQ